MVRRTAIRGAAAVAIVCIALSHPVFPADKEKSPDWKQLAGDPDFWKGLETKYGAGTGAVILQHTAETEVQLLEGKFALITSETLVEAIIDTTRPGGITPWTFPGTPDRKVREIGGAVYLADGRVHKVDKKDVTEISPYVEYSLYRDVHAKRLVAPEAGPHTIVEVRWRWVMGGGEGGAKQVATVGDFSNPKSVRAVETGGGYVVHVHRFDDTIPTRFSSYAIMYPPELGTGGLAQRYVTSGGLPQPVSEQFFSADGERARLRWEVSDRPAVPDEPLAPPMGDRATFVAVSPSGLTWAELGEVYYREHIVHDLSLDKPVEAKLAELTSGLGTPEEKAKAIARYVAGMRTVPVSIMEQGFEPHPARDVMQAGYGDSRDKSLLAVTLLRGAGIHAWPVLVRNRELGHLEEGLVALPLFDRMLVALELGGSRVWLDPAGKTGVPGDLPDSVVGVKGLLLDDHTSGLVDVGAARGSDRITRVIRGTLAKSGQLDGTFEIDAQGRAAADIRNALSGGDDVRASWAADAFRGIPGPLTVSAIEATGLDDPSGAVVVKGHLSGAVGSPGTGGSLELDPFIARLRTSFPELPAGERTTPIFFATAVTEVDSLTLNLPSDWRWSDGKRSVREASPAGRLVLDVRQEGAVLSAVRTLEIRRGQWPRENYPQIRTFVEAVRRATLPPPLVTFGS